jgi:hypothetical protein
MSRPVGACVVILLAVGAARPAEPADVKAAVARALPLLKKGAEGHVAHRTCFACHNQAIPIFALTAARTRGFPFADADLKKQLDFIAEFLGKNRAEYREGKGQGGQVDTAGYALLTLAAGGWKADETTEAVAEYLLLRDKDRDHWAATSNRPPSEAGDFTTTSLALRALRAWATPAQKERVAKRTGAARGWLLKAEPKDTEDRVCRLWGLQAAGAKEKELKDAADQLVKAQRKDGGWSQTDALESDAYATGSALVALHRAGGLATTDAVYRRGLAFLMKTQLEDGSWLVKSRSKPFQTYFESGFPHGKDQFISMAGSAWATTALADALPTAPARR